MIGESAFISPFKIPNKYLLEHRHCICVYYHDWHRTRRPKPAVEGGILPGVSQAVSAVPPTQVDTSAGNSAFSSPRNTLSSSTGIIVALNEGPTQNAPLLQSPPLAAGTSSTGLPFDEEAKLVYGVVISLRNMVKKLSGRFVAPEITST